MIIEKTDVYSHLEIWVIITQFNMADTAIPHLTWFLWQEKNHVSRKSCYSSLKNVSIAFKVLYKEDVQCTYVHAKNQGQGT